MPARKKERLISDIKKIAIIAGAGVLPAKLQQACQSQNINTVVVGFKGYTDLVKPDYWTRIGASGSTIEYLKSQDITDIVMIGAIKRPSLFDLWPDWVTFKFFFKSWINSFGDDGLLKAARNKLEAMGFSIHGVHQFMPELLMPEGLLTQSVPKKGREVDVQIGIKAARELGANDIGQAVLVKDGKVIARESQSGTSALIKFHGEEGAILVKMCKPQQDQDLDLPTLGPQTVKLCAAKKMIGIVGQAGHTLIVDQDRVSNLADQNEIFMLGVTIDE